MDFFLVGLKLCAIFDIPIKKENNPKDIIAGWSSWELVGLITRRSQVRVLSPLLKTTHRYFLSVSLFFDPLYLLSSLRYTKIEIEFYRFDIVLKLGHSLFPLETSIFVIFVFEPKSRNPIFHLCF